MSEVNVRVHEVNMKKVWQGCEVSKYQGYLQHKIKPVVRDKGKWGAQSKTWNKCGRGARLVNIRGTGNIKLNMGAR